MKRRRALSSIPIRIRIILMGLLVVLFPTFVLAADSSFSQEIYEVVKRLLEFLSWAWIIPASIAGKLMTNDFVYASFIHMDRYLWRMWQFMRAMAMFALGVLLLTSILRYFFKGTVNDLIGKVGKIALCAILIPLSRWLMAVLIDFSIILTASVGAIPVQVTQQQRNQMSQNFQIPKTINVNDGWFLDPLNNVSYDNYQNMELIDIMPKADSVSGPLIFLGASVLRIQELVYLPEGGEDNFKNIALGSLLKILIAVSVTIPIIILAVVNMMRIFYIRLWVVMSPFVVITHVFKDINLGETLTKYFRVSHMLGLIFQPPVIVGLLSLGMILVIGVNSVLVGNQENREELEEFHIYVNTEQDTAELGPPDLADIKVKGKLTSDLGPQVGGAMGELILMFFVIFVLWGLVKAGFSVSKLTEKTAMSFYQTAETYMKTSNVLPGGFSVYSAQQAFKKAKYDLTSTNRANDEAENLINKLYGDNGISARSSDFASARRAAQTGVSATDAAKQFWEETIRVTKSKQFTGKTRAFKSAVETWLRDGEGLDYLVSKKLITTDERNTYQSNLSQIRSNPRFNGFVDDILSSGKRDPQAQQKARKVRSIAEKTYGNGNR